MNEKRWWIADVVVGILTGLFGIFGIITGIKSSNYKEEQQFKDLEERYGLTPIEKKETE